MHSYTEYFKSSSGFDRFITKLYSKYKSFSKFSGIIKLDNLSSDEALALSKLFGTTYKEHDSISLSIKKFLSIMNNSRYEDFEIEILVQEYLNVTLVTNKERKDMCSQEEMEYYQSIIMDATNAYSDNGNKDITRNSHVNIDNNSSNYDNSNINSNYLKSGGSGNYSNSDFSGSCWLESVITSKGNPYKLIQQRYHKNKLALRKELINIITLINNLPKEKTLLPIYASTYTKDPHYLDFDNNHSTLFFYALSYIDKTEYPKLREEKIRLLSKYNIEIDNLSNFAITYNLLADKDYINKFAQAKESLILNIQNIVTTNFFDTKLKKVFIFENPSILTEILMKNIDVSVIISGGFPNTSVYLLIDRLLEMGNKLYYNGDFDPEGLLIAQKLKDKYGDKLELMCYSIEDYNNCISKKRISNSRLKKMNKINDKDLLGIKELVLNSQYAAYQENNKERIVKFIKDDID